MGEKTVEFRTSRSVSERGYGFQSGIQGGRGLSSIIGGLTAKAMGGKSLTFYTPEDDSPFAALNRDRPAFSVGSPFPRRRARTCTGRTCTCMSGSEGAIATSSCGLTTR